MDYTKRLDFIDFAKGFGIILVVGAHLLGEGGMSFSGSNFIRGMVYQFHMPAFFVISGFTIELSLEKNTKKKYERILKRALLLLICFYSWSLIYMYLSKYHFGKINYKEEFICMFSLRGRAPIWFLSALSIAELGYLVLRKRIESDLSSKKFIVFSILIIGCSFLLTYLLDIANFSERECSILGQYCYITLKRFFPSIAFITIGGLLYRFICNYHDGKVLLTMGILFFILTGIFTIIFQNGINMHTAAFGNVVFFYINSIVGSLALIITSKGICSFVKCHAILELGRNSLGIMVFHYPPYFMTFQYTQTLCKLLGGGDEDILSYIFCLVTSLFCTYLLTILIKRFKIFL